MLCLLQEFVKIDQAFRQTVQNQYFHVSKPWCMKQLFTFILLLLTGLAASAQLIFNYYTATHKGNFKTKTPKLIHQRTVTFYEEYAEQEIADLHFDSTGLQTEKIVYGDSGKITGSMIWHFGEPGKQLKYIAGNVWNAGKLSSDSALYHYDHNGFLSEVIIKDDQNTLLRQAMITCDSSGNHIEASFYDNRGKLLSTEQAQYLPEINKLVIRVTKADGSPPRTDSVVISNGDAAKFAAAGDTYNEQGDLIRTENYTPFKGKATLEISYLYDAYGNVVQLDMYKVKGKGRRETREAHVTIYRKYEY